MKKIIFTIAFFCACSVYSQTTMQEYNYMNTGYQIQVKTGQDINSGYRIDKTGSFGIAFDNEKKVTARRVTEFYSVYNQNSLRPTEPIGILMKMFRSDISSDTYFFMPNKYSKIDVLTKAYNDYIKIMKSTDIVQSYTWNMLQFMSSMNTK